MRGTVRVSDTLFGEQRVVDGVPPRGEVWADGALLARIDADVGDEIMVGGSDMLVSAVLTYRPDQSIGFARPEEHTSELQSRRNLVCRLLLEKKKRK